MTVFFTELASESVSTKIAIGIRSLPRPAQLASTERKSLAHARPGAQCTRKMYGTKLRA